MKKGSVYCGWEIDNPIRRFGHTGSVYLVHNVAAPKRVAVLKLFRKSFPERLSLFRNEERILLDPKVPAVIKPQHLGSGQDKEGTPFFVMEWVETLPEKLPHDKLIRVLKEIAAACATLEEAGYYHCDLKSSNIGFLNGHVVLIDFGCTMPTSEAHRKPVVAGTEKFQAPEVAKGMISVKSEIYSLGRTAVDLARWTSRYRLAKAMLTATEKSPEMRPAGFLAFASLLDQSDVGFMKAARLVTRFWFKTVLCAAVAVIVAATALVGHVLITMADTKRTFVDTVVRDNRREIAILAEKRLGRFCLGNSNRTEAVRHFTNAADLGDRQAGRILRLMKATEGYSPERWCRP